MVGARYAAAPRAPGHPSRRAERTVVALGPDAVPPIAVVYLNRLSDLLFAMARLANARSGVPEIEW